MAAEAVMAVFDEEWDQAPENDNLLSFYRVNDAEVDFYKVRKFIENILLNSYLFRTDS